MCDCENPAWTEAANTKSKAYEETPQQHGGTRTWHISKLFRHTTGKHPGNRTSKQMYADGRHCLQPKKATEIYNKKSTNQCSSNAGNPAGFIFTPNKPSQTNIFFIGDTLFKTKLQQQLKLAWRIMLLMELDSFANGSCTSATIVVCRLFFIKDKIQSSQHA